MTEQKLIVTRFGGHIITALMEDGQAAELFVSSEKKDPIRVGDIYVARVKKLVPNIGAAFLEILPGMECYYSLSGNPEPFFTKKNGKKPLCIGDELLVQVEREAVKTKVPTVTSKLSFTGRYAVVTTGNTVCGVSGKIQGKLREHWKETVRQWENGRYGIVIRTSAQNAPVCLVEQEVRELSEAVDTLRKAALTRTCFTCLKRAEAAYLSELKTLSGQNLTAVITEEEDLYLELKDYLSRNFPEQLEHLVLYSDRQLPLHKLYRIEHIIKEASQEKVWMKSGAYLVIQPTEALTVIDVNSGKCVLKKKDDKGFLKINLEAAREAARQIRLRNLSGIILIDFINLETQDEKELLAKELSGWLKKDSVRTELVDITKLQLFEITRRKQHRPLHETLSQLKYDASLNYRKECD